MFRVLVDDNRDAGHIGGDKGLVILRDPSCAVAALIKLHGDIDELLMDNDIKFRDVEVDGPGPEFPEGNHILGEYLHYCDGVGGYPPKVILVTANGNARNIMKLILDKHGYQIRDNTNEWYH